MSAEPRHEYTIEEYLAFEEQSEARHEYLNGDIYAMVGASKKHRRIQSSIVAYLLQPLRDQGCDISANDARIQPKGSRAFFYPDLVIECGDDEAEDDLSQIAANPVVIIEILSPSTRKFDAGEKFSIYKQIPSLKTYVLVSQDQPLIERHELEDSQWVSYKSEGLGSVLELPSVGCTLPLEAAYQGVRFKGTKGNIR